LLEHSSTMFVRRDGARWFGYFLRTYPTPAGGRTSRLEVALLRPARRSATSTVDHVFPAAADRTAPLEAPPINYGVSDLGLRLTLAPNPGPE
jgi:hypothetical protein